MRFNKEIALMIILALITAWLIPFFVETGESQTYNQTAILNVTVNITNSAPLVTSVTLQDPINLIAYNNVTVQCNASIFDYDNQTVVANATLYFQGTLATASDDFNTHYSNTSCTLLSKIDEAMNFTCSFDVSYYANNGTWLCNVTALDPSSSSSNNQSAGSTLNPLIAIRVPGIIDYGNLAQNEISANQEANITNAGNRDINISVRAYGVTPGDGLALDCQFGSIGLQWERYNITNSSDFTNMWQAQAALTLIPGYYIPQRTDDAQESINKTFWRLQIPVGAGGTCNGKLHFQATDRIG